MKNRYKNWDKDVVIKYATEKNQKLPRFGAVILNFNQKDRKKIMKGFIELRSILLQTPTFNFATTSIANFNLKKGMETGLKLTLRKEKLWNLLELKPINSFKSLDYHNQLKSLILLKSDLNFSPYPGILQFSFDSLSPSLSSKLPFLYSHFLIPFNYH